MYVHSSWLCVLTAPVPVDQTRNVGSIKAYQVARAQARVAGTYVNDNDEDDEYFAEDDDFDGDYGGSGGRKKSE